MYMRSEQTEPDRTRQRRCVRLRFNIWSGNNLIFSSRVPKDKLDVSKKTESNVFGETFGRFTANRTRCFCKTSGCFQLLLWRQNWIYIYQDLHIFSHISDINNIFFLTRRRDILSGVVATEQDIFNSICGDKTGHFLKDFCSVCCDKKLYFYHHVGTFSGPICGDRTRYFKHHVKVFFCAQTWPDDEETSHTV